MNDFIIWKKKFLNVLLMLIIYVLCRIFRACFKFIFSCLSPITNYHKCLKLFLGYTGTNCEKLCPSGTYGMNCSQMCSCNNFVNCDEITGKCKCGPGFMGAHCEIRCPSLSYGLNCQSKCNCSNGASCDPVNGTCICPAGYTGDQ